MLAMGDQIIDGINTQDLLINTDNAMLDNAAIEESQMWMDDWEDDDLVVDDGQQQPTPHPSQDLFSDDIIVTESQENFPNRESISDCSPPTPLTSTPSLLDGVRFTGKLTIDESIIELPLHNP